MTDVLISESSSALERQAQRVVKARIFFFKKKQAIFKLCVFNSLLGLSITIPTSQGWLGSRLFSRWSLSYNDSPQGGDSTKDRRQKLRLLNAAVLHHSTIDALGSNNPLLES